MNLKWIGAVIVVIGCGSTGLWMVAEHLRQERMLHQLSDVLEYIRCDLQYRYTSLPELCAEAGKRGKGEVYSLFTSISQHLDNQISPDAEHCVLAALGTAEKLPESVKQIMHQLGKSMGRFDSQGQLQVLSGVQEECRAALEKLARNKQQRLRSYQTLGLCAGAAIAILLI